MKLYKWLFAILTLSQFVFTVAWYLFTKNLDRVIIVSSIIYLGAMIISYFSYEVEDYRKVKQQLLDNLPH